MQWGSKRVRLSCGVKCKSCYWSKGRVAISHNVSRVDRILCENASKVINSIVEFVDVKYSDYLCGNQIDIEKELKDYTYLIMGKKEDKKIVTITSVWGTIIGKKSKKTAEQYQTNLSVFKRFMREEGIEDNIESLTTNNVRKYREWLAKSDREASTSRGLLNFVGNMCRSMKQEGYSHSIDWEAIAPIIDKRTNKEKADSKPALLHSEIKALEDLELKGTKKIVRDLLLIELFSGIRNEDLEVFLKSENLKEINGEKWIVITPDKTKDKSGTIAYIPLQKFYPQLLPLWEKYKDTKPIKYRTAYSHIKEIGQLANLNREIVVTSQKGDREKTKTTKKVWQLLSSHKGRRSFITNMQTNFDLIPTQIKEMSGHSSEKMITDVYTSMSEEDKMQHVDKLISSNRSNPTSTPTQTKQVDKPSESNNFLIDGIVDAKRVMRFLSIDFNDDISFDDAITEISVKQGVLMDEYGIKLETFKDLFNYSFPMAKRVEMLRALLDLMVK